MRTENRVILTGKVHNPPRKYCRPDGSTVVEFLLEWDDLEGQPRQGSRGVIDIVAMGPLAQTEPDRLRSGQPLRVEGRLNQRRWETPDGRYRSRMEVILTDLQWIAVEEQELDVEGRKG